MANQLLFSCLMLATGIGIPVAATLSATLGAKYGSPALAASVLFLVALLISVAFLFAVEGGPRPFPKTSLPLYFYLGGALVAFYMLSVARSLADGHGLAYGGAATTGIQPLATVLYSAIYWTSAQAGLPDTFPLRGVIAVNVGLLLLTGVLSAAETSRLAAVSRYVNSAKPSPLSSEYLNFASDEIELMPLPMIAGRPVVASMTR